MITNRGFCFVGPPTKQAIVEPSTTDTCRYILWLPNSTPCFLPFFLSFISGRNISSFGLHFNWVLRFISAVSACSLQFPFGWILFFFSPRFALYQNMHEEHKGKKVNIHVFLLSSSLQSRPECPLWKSMLFLGIGFCELEKRSHRM
ncbi:hypothetical protein BDZ91DRAFT_728749 [Kalaharituber pfeilii]|nr:hypothetical protein BDZ91DRAFT_728749 [Kalaharituber pfeilii]